MSDALDDCGCCGEAPGAPAMRNRAGLARIAYRAVTHGAFFRAMADRVPAWPVPPDELAPGALANPPRPLAALTTREASDPAIALLDAWACVADVLAFYQERIANEGFLGTATERRSILELARAIGYELKPGVAAAAHLCFIVEDAPGAPQSAVIEPRVRVLSVPGQDEKPQTFETIERIEARAEWNALRPRTTRKQDLAIDTMIAYFAGVATGLQPADVVVLVGAERERWAGSEAWDVRVVDTVTPVPARDHTVVTWRPGLGERPSHPAVEPRAYVFRVRAALFGHNAAEWDNLPLAFKRDGNYPTTGTEWPGFAIDTGSATAPAKIDLDAAYAQILPGSWLALVKPKYVELYRAARVETLARTGFGLVAKITRVAPDGKEHLDRFGLRETTVLAHSVEVPLAEEPDLAALGADADPNRDRRYIALDRRVTPLAAGRLLVVSGRRKRARAQRAIELVSEDGFRRASVASGDALVIVAAPLAAGERRWLLEDRNGFQGVIRTPRAGDIVEEAARDDDPVATEVAVVKANLDAADRTTLELETALTGWYDRDSVTLHANVVRATHGETVADEPLGSGDATLANQRFRLARPPLTQVSAETPSGAASTLEVRVDGVRWTEAPNLFGLGAGDERYAVRLDDDGTPRVIFGDGASGARLPTGVENVRATYRTGIGLAGEVAAGKLTLLQKRPFGVRGVTNPLPAIGAADPERPDDARANAPVTVLTLDRIVSLRDYEDFSRAFAGIGKASATALWNGETQVVHVTVGTARGEPVPDASELMGKLRAAIDLYRDAGVPVLVQGFRAVRFRVAAKVAVDPRHERAAVHAAILAALDDAFAYARRPFGQAVTQAEIVALMQRVAGVVAVDVDALHRDGDPVGLAGVLVAASARRSGIAYLPAELLLPLPGGVTLAEMTP